ncbi:HAF repeat-containing protein [Pseudoduganella sp.]|uniref:HAF repeat-containing protein n=1 Tax=Pseudoduganella sp. TaxID=1880898 RepID=UPI0035B2652B
MKRIILALASLLAASAVQAGPFGGSISETIVAKDMNAKGESVFESIVDIGYRSAFLRSGGLRYDIGTFGGRESIATAINDAGWVTGAAQTASNQWRAYRFHKTSGLRQLDTLGGASSTGTAINELGHVVGHSDTYDGQYHAFVDTGITMLDLGTFGGKNSYALGINKHGTVVGAADHANGFRRAFIYKPGIGKIEIPGVGERHSIATSVNDHGVVVGTMQMKNHLWHAFSYDGVRTVDLGAMTGNGSSVANAINNRGDIVGNVRYPGKDTPLTFIYSDGKMQVRDTYGKLDLARRITDDGQVIGANMIQYQMQAARVARDKARSLDPMPLQDQLTYALYAVLATFVLYKLRQHVRDGIKFGVKFLSFA